MQREAAEKTWNGERQIAPAQLVASVLPKLKWEGRLTNSARTSFLNCRQKFAWSYLYRLSPRLPQIPFLVGNLVHEGLDRLYKTWEFDEAEERNLAAEKCEKACQVPGITQELSDKIWIQQAIVIGILKGYANHYLKEDKKKWEIVSAEEAFKYQLPPAGILPLKGDVRQTDSADGKRDLVVRDLKSKKVLLVEHKTVTRLDAAYIAKLPLDNQILGYANSMSKEKRFAYKLPDKIVYNVMRKAALRQGQKETFVQFTKRIEDDYMGAPTMYFYRESLTFSKESIKRYEDELLRFVKEFDRAIKEGNFYQNTTQCTSFGSCAYMRLCAEGPNKDTLLHYQERANVHAELDGEVYE